MDIKERRLVQALRTGASWSFRDLEAAYLNRVFGYVVGRVARREDAEDVTCEVFVAAVQSVASFRGDSSLLTWLIGIARRKVADHQRRCHRQEVLESELPPDGPSPFAGLDWNQELPDEFLCREETAQIVRRAIAELPDAQREVLLLQFSDGLSIREIAEATGRSQDSVKASIRRAKQALFQRLASQLGGTDDPPVRIAGDAPQGFGAGRRAGAPIGPGG